MLYSLIKFIYRTLVKSARKVNRVYWSWRVQLSVQSYKSPPKANFKSHFTKNTYLGKNTNFNGMEISGKGKVVIGDNFHSGRQCKIITTNHNFQGNKIPYDETYIHKDVIIEDNVWLGDNIIILGGVSIGEGAIIQAGSVVVKSIPKLAIAGGHPALPFKYRNERHYYELKRKGQFL